ncbi:hypothetical protein AB0C81_08845 [Streptomyces roseoverticillatus]|uniref:hypothetical protein n=1 Tax=Streptomyces roseoverticillatus TaxID=66429 RepID=UPI0033D0D26A
MKLGPSGEHALAHGRGKSSEIMELTALSGHLADNPETVCQTLAGGRSAPSPVPVRDFAQMMDGSTLGPLNQGVTS